MLIICPSCKTKFSFDDSKIGSQGIKLRCSKCRTIFSVTRKEEIPPPAPVPPSPPVAATPTAREIKIIIANESASFCAAVAKVLEPEPFTVLTFNDGKEAFDAVQRVRPDVILLDVALPSMYGFEVCERIRNDPALSGVKIILIAAIYDKTRYKRSPISLYGADDYIEKHHIPDSLVSMIYRYVTNQKPMEKPAGDESATVSETLVKPQHLEQNEIDAQLDTRRQMQAAEARETVTPAAAASSEAHEKAKRLARIIVSDIILYNQAKVEEGVKNGSFYSLLEDDIREGRALYERRVPEEIRENTSFLDTAFEELIAKKKQELKL